MDGTFVTLRQPLEELSTTIVSLRRSRRRHRSTACLKTLDTPWLKAFNNVSALLNTSMYQTNNVNG